MNERNYSKKYIGKKYITNEGYTALIIDGGSKPHYCTIKINDWIKEVCVDNLKIGKVKYPYNTSIYKKGFIGVGTYKAKSNGKDTNSYKSWKHMLSRCYDNKLHAKQPTYKECTVCKEWLNYQNFAEWFEKNHVNGFQLDKDLLVSGNKIYSEDTCAFIPRCLNSFVSNRKLNNTSGYTGIHWNKQRSKWHVRIHDTTAKKDIYLGAYDDVEQAILIYKKARTTMAHKMKHKMILDYGIMDLRILDAIDKL